MFSGIAELALGALIILGIFAAFMVWAVFPLLSFAICGAAYGLIRNGAPALGRGALAFERGAIRAVRRGLHPLAVWALREPAPAYSHGEGNRGR